MNEIYKISDYESVLRVNKQYTPGDEKLFPEVITLAKAFLGEQAETEIETRKKLKAAKRARNRKPKRQVVELVRRKDPYFTESYHSQMEELAHMGSGE